MKIKTAIIQFNIQEGKTDANMQKAQELLAAAALEQVDLLILPEMWNSGFAFTELASLAQDFNGEVVSLLRGDSAAIQRFYHRRQLCGKETRPIL